MSKSNFGCTIHFKNEEDVFSFYKECKDYISSMTVTPDTNLEVSFKFKPGTFSYIKEKYKGYLKTLHGNSYSFGLEQKTVWVVA